MMPVVATRPELAMRTVGVDLAASPQLTAVAAIDWYTDKAVLADVFSPADDAAVLAAAATAHRVGIDAPFGWPDEFVEFVAAHHAGALEPGTGLDDIARRRPLAYRRTDRAVIDDGAGAPLSVSADRIAHVAFRCAGLLADLGVVDRVDGAVAECYPAAALRRWGLPHRGYKGRTNRGRLEQLVDAFTAAVPWLDLSAHPRIRTDDNCFDAVITAVIARAVTLGATALPAGSDWDVAAREGWIHVPTAPLAALAPAGLS